MDSLHEKVSSLLISQPTEEENSEDIVQCPICQEKTTKTCSACKSVAYCCVDHQRMDWKNHKKVCQPFSIQKVEGMGMGWVATRDIKAGVILLEEAPAIQSPNWKNFSSADDKNCVTCAIEMKSKRKCSTCSWPVCSKECEKNSLHLDNECKEFVSREIKYPPHPNWPVGMLIMCIRANGMKARDPKKFKQLMALQDFYDIPSANQKLQKLDLPDGMLKLLKGPNSLDEDEFRKLLRICQVNSFGGDSNRVELHFSDGLQGGKCVYIKISRINHSCVSNCSTTRGPNRIRIRTTVSVKKGQQFTINFYDDGDFGFMPTDCRQQRMKDRGFICKCKRCLDLTELGTFLLGIKCFNCSGHLKAGSDGDKVGFLVPANPLDLDSPDPDFECHRCHVRCSLDKIIATFPVTVQQDFHNSFQWLSPDFRDLTLLERLVTQFEKGGGLTDYLHPNHFFVQNPMRKLVQAQLNFLHEMTEEKMDRLVSRLVFFLSVDDKLYPGLLYQARYSDLYKLLAAILVSFDNFGRGMPRQKLEKLSGILNKAAKEQVEFLKIELDRASEEVKSRANRVLKQVEDLKKKFERALLYV